MPKRSPRDLFWLVLVAAMGCGWLADRTAQAWREAELEGRVKVLEAQLETAIESLDQRRSGRPINQPTHRPISD